ncbi:MAG: thioredoxin [Eubacterium sp.]|nr:thioredoxin [Eubacterium sp.]
MAVQHITEAEFEEVVVKSETPVFVDFYATWCGPCKMMSPILEQVSEEVPEVKFAAIDVDEAEALAVKYGISSIPCMVLFKNGEEADRVVGAVPKQKIVDTVKG